MDYIPQLMCKNKLSLNVWIPKHGSSRATRAWIKSTEHKYQGYQCVWTHQLSWPTLKFDFVKQGLSWKGNTSPDHCPHFIKPIVTFLHCFNIAFPYKRVNLRERSNQRWLSKRLIVSSKRMQTLNILKRIFTLTREDLIYIGNYQRLYKRVLREAKKRENRGML